MSKSNKDLAVVLREHAEQIAKSEPQRESDQDTAELVRVLARIIEGKTIGRAFGAPGDWGYNNPIGQSLFEFLKGGGK